MQVVILNNYNHKDISKVYKPHKHKKRATRKGDPSLYDPIF